MTLNVKCTFHFHLQPKLENNIAQWTFEFELCSLDYFNSNNENGMEIEARCHYEDFHFHQKQASNSQEIIHFKCILKFGLHIVCQIENYFYHSITFL